jgi:hypothetical protein
MHRLESFALSAGSKISRPHIEQSFYPIPDKKFICVSRKAECDSKSYDFMDDVIFHIKSYLDAEGISIYEIGESNQKKLFYTKNYSHLNRLQSSYLINKSLLYLGNYNLYTNIASYMGKPCVCPMNVEYTDLFKPYWSSEGECMLVTPSSNLKPSFSPKEHPKTINDVHPEEVAKNVLDLLGIKHTLDKVSTVYVGEEYKQNIIDIVPGEYDIQAMNVTGPVNIRMDKEFNLEFLARCAQLEHVNIVTDKPISKQVLGMFSDNLKMISFFIDLKTEEDSINNIISKGTPLNLLSKDMKNISEIRLKFIDHEVRLFGTKSKKDLKTKVYSDLRFLSKRNIIAKGQIFNSYLSLSLEQNISQVKNKKEFWEDLPFCRIFRENP